MKLQYLSDLHLEVAVMDVPITDADVVVLAGDIHSDGKKAVDWASKFPQDVIYVIGNHEYYSGDTIIGLPDRLKAYSMKYENVHVLNNDSLIINDVAFHGCTLWTDFELYGNAELAFYYARREISDYQVIRFDEVQAFTPALATELHKNSAAWLKGAIASSHSSKNVVITHHLPTPKAIQERFADSKLNPAFASDCHQLFQLDISTWIFGHNHCCQQFEIKGIDFVSNQRGYYGYENIANFSPYKIIEI
ncbi:metallophosphoesterase [Vibrio sp. 10N.286.51.C3]|uniref:metallophosphoesterase n=1 Tax=unclassified Vibrio TaxID=2614977 RepID=UPI000D3BE6D3|nr:MULTISPECIES: metallophosphoesterase [unclassified Vibrio]PTP13736.1 metallophosphoesterase [Vibrio sp. 10N.286.51.C3]TKE73855.1 metallophosphoesterase [Vibrio sp. F12]